MDVEPICPYCYQPMRTVTVHHANRRTTQWPLCPTCLTTRTLDMTDTPIDLPTVEPGGRHLRAV